VNDKTTGTGMKRLERAAFVADARVME